MAVIGSGSTRANVTAFVGNQYQMPEQTKQLTLFFSLQIFSIKVGSLFGRFMNSILEEDLQCFGQKDCYSLALGIAAVVMIVSLLLFLGINSHYIRMIPGGNMLVNVSKSVMARILKIYKTMRTPRDSKISEVRKVRKVWRILKVLNALKLINISNAWRAWKVWRFLKFWKVVKMVKIVKGWLKKDKHIAEPILSQLLISGTQTHTITEPDINNKQDPPRSQPDP